MTEPVIIQIIIQGGVILGAIIAGIFGIIHTRRQKQRDQQAVERDRATSEKLEVVREHVQNSHATNLRDDLDAIAALIEAVSARLELVERDGRARDETIMSEVRGVRRDVGRLGDSDIQQAAERADLRKKVDDLGDRYHHLER